MNGIMVVFKRELCAYFVTPIAYIFVITFLVLSGVFTFYLGNFYEIRQASLTSFFNYHPWLYLFLIPALSMRMWAEDRRSGSLEILLTLPVSLYQVILGKYMAVWILSGIALLLTFPIWITVNYLGNPDNGIIMASYLGSWLMAGALASIGSSISASTNNQVIAFIITAFLCLLFILAGLPIVLDFFNGWVSQWLIDGISQLSFITHFQSINRGVLDIRDILYFIIMMITWISASAVIIDMKKAD